MLKKYLTAALIAATMTLALRSALADHEKGHYTTNELAASDFIGKKVKSAQDEDLGKIQDLILILDSGNVTVPYVVVAHGGILGAGRTKTVVPMSSLSCSADGKSVVLSASKEQLQAASKTPSQEWSSLTNASWAKSVDGFYGQPYEYSRERVVREEVRDSSDTRRFVRDPAPKGAELLIQPADQALCERICEATEIIQVRVENGVTHLYGQVPNEATRESIEAKVRAVPGVQKVESHLKVKNP
jgi:sporulation protein YlmC with PRC-barrel domain